MQTCKQILTRVPKELWVFMKNRSITQEESINNIMIQLIEKYKKKCEKAVDNV